ncbi:hypothetical protein wTpre_923 [Wolbachia endosymbiont of Trichogramma pretiosum]|nr:hypothetical protein wTpre_923 [Wolbachia endosymbiont of Trichogramma pretiosum]
MLLQICTIYDNFNTFHVAFINPAIIYLNIKFFFDACE